MDLIGTLSSQLGISPDQAKAVAGGVMGMVKGNLEDSDEDGTTEAAGALEQAVPEMSDWQQAATDLVEGKEEESSGGGLGGMLGGMLGGGGASSMLGSLTSGGALGALAGAVGGEDAKNTAVLVQILGKVGLDSSKAQMVAPMAYEFLKGRLPEGIMSKVSMAAPMLTKFL